MSAPAAASITTWPTFAAVLNFYEEIVTSAASPFFISRCPTG